MALRATSVEEATSIARHSRVKSSPTLRKPTLRKPTLRKPTLRNLSGAPFSVAAKRKSTDQT